MRILLSILIVAVVVLLLDSSRPLVYAQSINIASQLRPIQQNGKWGYIDNTGKIVVKPQFVWAEEFSEGLAAFENEDGKHGFIDETGKVVIDPKDDILNGTFSEGVGIVQFISNSGPDAVLIDKTGKTILAVQDIETRGFSEGLVPAKKNKKWGYVDTQGQFAIEPQFAEAHSFSEGLAAVLVGEKWGFIDHSGRMVITRLPDLCTHGRYSGEHRSPPDRSHRC